MARRHAVVAGAVGGDDRLARELELGLPASAGRSVSGAGGSHGTATSCMYVYVYCKYIVCVSEAFKGVNERVM